MQLATMRSAAAGLSVPGCACALLPACRRIASTGPLRHRKCKHADARSPVASIKAEASDDAAQQPQSALPFLPAKRERYQRDLSRADKNKWRKASQQLGKDITVVTIGRAGITHNTLVSLGDALAGNELVKVRQAAGRLLDLEQLNSNAEWFACTMIARFEGPCTAGPTLHF